MSDVHLPKAIREQVAQAEALQQQMQAPPAGAETVSLEQLAAPQPSPAPAPEPQPEPTAQGENYEHKFKTLQGMFRAEVNNQVAAQLQQSRQREAKLLESLQQLEQKVTTLSTQQAKPAAPMDPKDVEAFGIELVEMVRRQASTEIASAVSTAVREITTRLDSLEQMSTRASSSAAMSAEQMFYFELGTLVPDWKAINGDAGFLTWLGEVDPVYGEQRQAALDRASSSMNAERAAAVFAAYKATLAKPTPKPTSELESQVAPGRSSGAPTNTQTQVQYVTQAQILKFYDDMRRGVYRGKQAEADAIEAAINLAIAESRVR